MENDKKAILSIVEEMSKSMTGAQSTKHWADNAMWFDIAPFASKGVKPAKKAFDDAFGQLKTCKIEILETETYINGDMGVVCMVQRWNTATKDGTVNPPMLVRQTDCFEKQDGEWKVIHEHTSVPVAEWDGKVVTD
ncbi:nuclear transport factor 2 family protein [Clostridium sp. Mt-5]|uniref:Nuclear transport factor 2 family protein n=1 Tax=Clostridium moutaii TaxID=3240932 RepID=A0ABV4BRX0_9CLOT